MATANEPRELDEIWLTSRYADVSANQMENFCERVAILIATGAYHSEQDARDAAEKMVMTI